MIAMSHVILHLGLCHAMTRVAPQTQMAVHVRLVDRLNRQQFDEVFTVPRHDSTMKVVEFDMPRGEYQIQISAPKYGCNAMDYLMFLPDRDRVIAETLSDGPAPATTPMLMEGEVPSTFLYLKPTFVIFPRETECNKAVPDPLPLDIQVENDQDAYYAWLYPDATNTTTPVVVALRLKTATGGSHYVRLHVPFPMPWGGWPSAVQFSLSENDVDGLAGEPVDTLLCPHMTITSAG